MKRITPEARGVWRLRSTLTKQAIFSKDDRLFIPPFDTGKTYTSQFIAVGVRVSNSKDNWRSGGYLSQEFKFTSSGYNTNNKAFNQTQDLLINEVLILNLPLLSQSEYRLRYFPPTYFLDVKLQIWEYEGTENNTLASDVVEYLDLYPPSSLLNNAEINAKLEQLLANQQSGISVDLSAIEAKLNFLIECCDCSIEPEPKPPQGRVYLLYYHKLL